MPESQAVIGVAANIVVLVHEQNFTQADVSASAKGPKARRSI